MPERLIVFVCTGNICRSPMAEYMLRDKLGQNSDWSVASAGVSAFNGASASPPAIDSLGEIDIDLAPHRSQILTRKLAEKADLIVAMTSGHRAQIERTYPSVAANVHLLRDFDPNSGYPDIDDPIGGTVDHYRRTRRDIASALPGLMAFMKAVARKPTA